MFIVQTATEDEFLKEISHIIQLIRSGQVRRLGVAETDASLGHVLYLIGLRLDRERWIRESNNSR